MAWLGLALLTLLCAACTRYQAHPIDPAQLHDRFLVRRLDDPVLAQRLQQALPPRDHGQWPPPAYGRAELLLAALALNPDLAEARAHLAQASAAVTTAGARPNPTLGLALDRYTQAQAGSSPWLWGITTDLLLDTALRRRLRLQLADAGVRAARLDYAEALWKVDQSLREALAALLLAERQQALATQAVAAATALRQGMLQRVRLGEASASEALQAATSLAQAQATVATAAERAATARARLARTIGVPLPALRDIPLRWDGLEHPSALDGSRLQRLSRQALLSRADLERALVDYDQRELELRQQVRLQYPQISLGPGYTYDHGVRKLTFNASASLPLFNQNQGPIAEARARREAAGLHVEAVQESIDNDIEGAQAKLRVALGSLRAARGAQRVAHQQTSHMQRAEELGAQDHRATLEARLAELAAAQVSLQALDQAWQAEAALEDALRMPLDPAEAQLLSPTAGEHP